MHRQLAFCASFILALFCALASTPASAVLIAWGHGHGNLEAPADDPGWSHVGIRGGASAVYLGEGWVLTAAHVGPGAVTLEGVSYPAVPESAVPLRNADGSLADLVLFRIEGEPALERLPVAERGFEGGTTAVLIGYGRDRGEPLCFTDSLCGFYWGADHSMRWGTNRITGPSEPLAGSNGITTWSFFTDFSPANVPGATTYEAQATVGDSGGAVFVKHGDVWELAGVMVAIQDFIQPPQTALHGNQTYAADLAIYRDQILETAFAPSCGNACGDAGDGGTESPEDPGSDPPQDESQPEDPAGDPAGDDPQSEDPGGESHDAETQHTPDLHVSPRESSFGDVEVGSEGRLAIPLSNVGTEPLTIGSLALYTYPGIAIAELPELPLTLEPNAEASIEMSFTPEALGASHAMLMIQSDDPEEASLAVTLRGTGVHRRAACIELKEFKIERERDKQDDDKLEIRELELVLPDGERLNLEQDAFALHLNGVQMWPDVPGDFDFDWDKGKGASKFKRDKVDLGAFEYAPWALVDVTSGLVRGSIVVPLEVTQDSENDHKLEFKRDGDSVCEEL